MKKAAIVAAVGLLGFAAWRIRQAALEAGLEDAQAALGGWDVGNVMGNAESVLSSAGQSAAQFIDNITGGIMQLSAMSRLDRAIVGHPNVQAFLRVIRAGEGTSDDNGYRRLFGGQLFDSYADHPRIVVRKSGYTSSAAGAYQFLASTWDETRRLMGLGDFSPASQDIAAVGRIAARGALADVVAGRFDSAISKVAKEWASMPGSPYGQPTITLQRARTIYASAGGASVA